jgi:hypothetical protein
MKFGVWEEVDLPEGKQALPSFFIFEVKRDGRYKARLVAGGHRQQQGLDFEETYASVGSYRTMRMMMAVAAHENLELRQFDVRTAFLNGWLKEEVYLRVPAGLERKLGTGGKVLRLRRAIYGLKQASRAWNERLEGELARKGFMQSDTDPSLWILHGKDGAVLARLRRKQERRLMRWWSWWGRSLRSGSLGSQWTSWVSRFSAIGEPAPSPSRKQQRPKCWLLSMGCREHAGWSRCPQKVPPVSGLRRLGSPWQTSSAIRR